MHVRGPTRARVGLIFLRRMLTCRSRAIKQPPAGELPGVRVEHPSDTGACYLNRKGCPSMESHQPSLPDMMIKYLECRLCAGELSSNSLGPLRPALQPALRSAGKIEPRVFNAKTVQGYFLHLKRGDRLTGETTHRWRTTLPRFTQRQTGLYLPKLNPRADSGRGRRLATACMSDTPDDGNSGVMTFAGADPLFDLSGVVGPFLEPRGHLAFGMMAADTRHEKPG